MDLSLDHILPKTPEARLRKGWPTIWLVGSVAWVVVIVLLLAIPTDPKNRQLLGFSVSRLGLLGIAFSLFVLNLVLAWLAKSRVAWRQRYLDPLVMTRTIYISIVVGLSAIAAGLWAGAFIYNNFSHPIQVIQRYAAYYERLFPFAVGIFLQCVILVIGLLILRAGIQLRFVRENRSLWLITLGILGIFLGIWAGMEISRVGLTPDKVGWGSPGVPLLFYQVLLAWLAGLCFFAILLIPKHGLSRWQRTIIDIIVCVIIWAAAVIAWSDQHVQRSYFAPSPTPPNEEIYPYSDAGFYDYTAQSVLLGYGFLDGKVVPRPLYILLLAGFHAIAGPSYKPTIYIQTLLLATLPVFLYLLGKVFHSRGLGLSLAILAIFREINSILATPWVEVSHSKLIMADLPTMIASVILTWLTVQWLTDAKRRWTDALLVGGALGICMLLRTQSILFLPVIILAAAWYYWKQWKRLAQVVALVGLGLILVISPWLVRNWMNTGSLVFDDPATQSAMVAQRYSTEMGAMPIRQPGETEAAYSRRLSANIREFLLANPGVVTQFVTAHTLNNLVSAVLVLPTYFSIDQKCDTYTVCNPFWIGLTSDPTPGNVILVFLNLAVVAFGIATSWKRWKLAGMIPLIFLMVYSLSNGLARNSARRYILPVDWVSYLYLLVGLFEIAFWVAVIFGAKRTTLYKGLTQPSQTLPETKRSTEWIRIGTFALIFLLIGATLPLAEITIPAHFPKESQAQLTAEFLNTDIDQQSPQTRQELGPFTQQEGFVALKGSVFYPRYYPALQGEPGSGWPAYNPYEYRQTGKVGFILIGPQGATQVNLALDESPAYFPNAADAIVVGCQEKGYVDALLVKFIDGSNETIWRSKLDNLTCPLK